MPQLRSVAGPRRVGWIDDVKGIGIILVVIGHTYEAYAGVPYGPIYLFHMPLFFFMAGVVFRPEPLSDYVTKRIRTLLLPYAAFLALLVLAKIALGLAHGADLPAVLAEQAGVALAYVYGGRALMGDYGIAWFITCLFVTLLAYDMLRLWLGRPWGLRLAAAAAGCFVLAYWIGPVDSPWDVTVVPMALVFVWLGELWSTLLAAEPAGMLGLRLRPDGALAASAALALAAAGLLWARPFDMKYGDFGTPVLSVAAAVGCIHVLATACRRLSALPGFDAVFALLGRASIVIFFLHRFVILHVWDRLDPVWTFALALLLPLAGFLLLTVPGMPVHLRWMFLGERRPQP